MRGKAAIVACVGLALLAASCNPLERRYADEGAGVNLYSGDGAAQIALLKEYVTFVCAQVGMDQSCGGSNWTTFVQAGMNDIDQRCDGYLTWLDARRRDKEPILAELGLLAAATHAIMTVTGNGPKSLNIVATAFGVAMGTYSNWNSRLLISVEKSTIQEVVYGSQGKFREKINGHPVPDMPAAVYLLRNYLRLCMPITIEATFNTSTVLVQRDPAAAAKASREGNLVVKNFTPTRVLGRSDQSIEPGVITPIMVDDGVRIGRFEQTLRQPQIVAYQSYACMKPDAKFTETLRNQIMGRLESTGRKDQAFPDRLTARDGVMIRIDIGDGNKANGKKSC